MHKFIAVCVLCGLAVPAYAKLYKCEDANGNTVYTDQACEGGEEIKLPPLQTYTPVKVPTTSSNPVAGKGLKKAYTRLEITSPQNDKQVYTNTGTVNIVYNLSPGLKKAKGHKFTMALDGKQLPSKGVTSQIKLSNIDRGTHTVQVFVVDTSNQILLSSNTVTFHLKKESLIKTPIPGSPQPSQPAVAAPGALRAPGF